MALFLVGGDARELYSAPTNGFTDLNITGTVQGTDWSLGGAYKLISTAGAVGETQMTLSNSNDGGAMLVAVRAASQSLSVDLAITLVDVLGNALANLTGIKWAWFDSADPNTFAAPTDKGNAETTDGNGLLEITLTNTTLTAGQTGTLVLFLNSGTDYASFRITL